MLSQNDYARLVDWANRNPYLVLSMRWHNHPKTRKNW